MKELKICEQVAYALKYTLLKISCYGQKQSPTPP